MMSAMVMSVLERTRVIGTLRALGWSRRQVIRLILGEALALGAAGGLAGIAIGLGLTWLAAQIPGVGSFLEGSFSVGLFMQGQLPRRTRRSPKHRQP
jgi:putative ABC transport system permease protein